MSADLTKQVTVFCKEHADVDMECDAFLHMVDSLDDSSDASTSVEDSWENSAGKEHTSPDTTVDSEAPTTPSKSEWLLGSPRTSVSPSGLARKLAQTRRALDLLQMDHDTMTTAKTQQDSAVHNLERQCTLLRQSLDQAKTRAEDHTAYTDQLTSEVEKWRRMHQSEQNGAQHALAKLEDERTSALSLDAALQSQAESLEEYKVREQTYQAEVRSLRETCAAQHTAITGLEQAVATLEEAQLAADRLQGEYETFQTMYSELQTELQQLRWEPSTALPALDKAWVEPDRASAASTSLRRVHSAPQLGRTVFQLPLVSVRDMDVRKKETQPRPPARRPLEAPARLDRPSALACTSPHAAAHVHSRWVQRGAPWALLVVGAWLGIWLHHWAVDGALRAGRPWAEANVLYDPFLPRPVYY